MIALDPRFAALVLIDLQAGIVSRQLAPRGGPDVVNAGRMLAERFRAARSPVVLVRAAFAADFADAPPGLVDEPMPRPEGGFPPDWTSLADGLAEPTDILITKRQWGAFYGTELDLQLRRRGVRTLVIGGVATNFGVESTVRQAWEYGYDVCVAEDACASVSAELHDVAIRHIFPRAARVVQAADIAFAA
ncbi:isochorismatase hydrolase [Methylocella silvestris BL2]|uniref:Isochorismatase hydrolase n=1 Tax=Methylocella silvestris (strain DSM 15510 / CIP 108128 / LMG 27833 / NCIMB 13906 / BL2) TaxID=395965 RepID=B8ELT4_METSB|nr:hydrolase [Methylocella silvestris]ACK50715.1 isochorismatase hydrolase [Methylocella silvestris BL2]